MPRRRPRSRGALVGLTLLALYALVVLVSPLLHHDFECHARTPAHCQACVASPMATPTTVLPVLWSGPLPVAGEVTPPSPGFPTSAFRISLSGRAPPA